MPSTFRWGAATHPCRPSGVVHPPRRWTNWRLGRPAGQARTGSLASGIRYTCEQAHGRAQAVQPRCVQPALRYWHPTGPGPANAAEARQGARIPDVSPVPSSLAPGSGLPKPGTPPARRLADPDRDAIRPWPVLRRRRCRSANQSAWLQGVRSGLPCRSPGKAGNPVPLRAPSGSTRR